MQRGIPFLTAETKCIVEKGSQSLLLVSAYFGLVRNSSFAWMRPSAGWGNGRIAASCERRSRLALPIPPRHSLPGQPPARLVGAPTAPCPRAQYGEFRLAPT